ncbi:hypothetical protein JTE90_021188 [Oedothorax gibbosus]|uniref:Uncharacterized protein n=1 Tax=Oedothorax gibbosus TaxID=931172 RepID=A0AAV6V5L1_9ARAC|nr:hypothetical protein JTE90_021188 [Oedothorax gibbosus]
MKKFCCARAKRKTATSKKVAEEVITNLQYYIYSYLTVIFATMSKFFNKLFCNVRKFNFKYCIGGAKVTKCAFLKFNKWVSQACLPIYQASQPWEVVIPCPFKSITQVVKNGMSLDSLEIKLELFVVEHIHRDGCLPGWQAVSRGLTLQRLYEI